MGFLRCRLSHELCIFSIFKAIKFICKIHYLYPICGRNFEKSRLILLENFFREIHCCWKHLRTNHNIEKYIFQFDVWLPMKASFLSSKNSKCFVLFSQTMENARLSIASEVCCIFFHFLPNLECILKLNNTDTEYIS